MCGRISCCLCRRDFRSIASSPSKSKDSRLFSDATTSCHNVQVSFRSGMTATVDAASAAVAPAAVPVEARHRSWQPPLRLRGWHLATNAFRRLGQRNFLLTAQACGSRGLVPRGRRGRNSAVRQQQPHRDLSRIFTGGAQGSKPLYPPGVCD